MSEKLTSLTALLKDADSKDPIVVKGEKPYETPFIRMDNIMGTGKFGGMVGLSDSSPAAIQEHVARMKDHGSRRFVLTNPDGEKSPPAPGLMLPQDMYEQEFDGKSMSSLKVGEMLEIKHPEGTEPSCFVERIEDGEAPEIKIVQPSDLTPEMKAMVGRELAKRRLLEGLAKGGPDGLKEAVKGLLMDMISDIGMGGMDVPDDWDCGDPDCEGCKARKDKLGKKGGFKKDED